MRRVEHGYITGGANGPEMIEMDGDRDTGFSLELNGPARVGAELRGVRERLGWSLDAIAVRLKVRLGFLEAIEAGDLAALPAPTYAAGFIRSYAEALGLDPEEILRRFRAEGMTRAKQPVLTFPEPVPERGMPPGALALLVAVIAIGLYVVWYRHSEHRIRMAETIPPVPVKLAPLALPKALPKAPPAPSSVPKPAVKAKPAALVPADTGATKAAPAQAAPPPAVTPAPQPDAAPTAGANAPPEGPPPIGPAINVPDIDTPAPPAQSASAPAINAPASQSNAPPAPVHGLAVSASATSWIEIRDISGTILFSRVLHPGQSWPIPDEPGLTLTTGNAGGTELVKNGVAGPPLGPPGAVIRNALITPSGTVVPSPPALHLQPPAHRSSYRRPQRPDYTHGADPKEPVNPFAISTKGYQ